jgi:hypothetical protein
LFSLLKLTVGLKVRLLGMLILLLGGVGLACASWQNEQNLVDQRVTQTRFLVETAATIVEHHRESVHQGKVTAAAAKAAAIAELRELRYGEDDYFWINDMAPVMVMHPMKPELEGKNIGNMKHPKGHKLFASMVAVVRDHGAGGVELGGRLGGMLDEFSTTLREVDHAVSDTTQAARLVASASQSISGGAHKQAKSLERTAASLEQMTPRPAVPARAREAQAGHRGRTGERREAAGRVTQQPGMPWPLPIMHGMQTSVGRHSPRATDTAGESIFAKQTSRQTPDIPSTVQ